MEEDKDDEEEDGDDEEEAEEDDDNKLKTRRTEDTATTCRQGSGIAMDANNPVYSYCIVKPEPFKLSGRSGVGRLWESIEAKPILGAEDEPEQHSRYRPR